MFTAQYLGSYQFYRMWGSTDEGFVHGLYRVLLHRDCNPTEVREWLQALANNYGDRTATASAFLACVPAEHPTDPVMFDVPTPPEPTK